MLLSSPAGRFRRVGSRRRIREGVGLVKNVDIAINVLEMTDYGRDGNASKEGREVVEVEVGGGGGQRSRRYAIELN